MFNKKKDLLISGKYVVHESPGDVQDRSLGPLTRALLLARAQKNNGEEKEIWEAR